MNETILICSDLDRTILPNGSAPESPAARPLLRSFVAAPGVTLAYVSGRSEDLIREAIDAYDLPRPDHAIGDVGTSLYRVNGDDFVRDAGWDDTIGEDWGDRRGEDLASLFEDLEGLELQEDDKQARFKLSYYVDLDRNEQELRRRIRSKLDEADVRGSLIWSIDEAQGTGLLDVLPASATKLHAVRFLRERLGTPVERTVFAGDSGNDLPALTSELQAVLVANARQEVRRQAVDGSTDRDRLYLARGGFLGMNGNYAAGVLEGVAHFVEDVRRQLESLARA